jgi:hypothetical protein
LQGDDRADAGLVQQFGDERDMADDLALELVGLLGRRLDPARKRASCTDLTIRE